MTWICQLCSMTNTSEKYERTQQGNLLSKSTFGDNNINCKKSLNQFEHEGSILVKCPTQPTCITHFDLCICHLTFVICHNKSTLTNMKEIQPANQLGPPIPVTGVLNGKA